MATGALDQANIRRDILSTQVGTASQHPLLLQRHMPAVSHPPALLLPHRTTLASSLKLPLPARHYGIRAGRPPSCLSVPSSSIAKGLPLARAPDCSPLAEVWWALLLGSLVWKSKAVPEVEIAGVDGA